MSSCISKFLLCLYYIGTSAYGRFMLESSSGAEFMSASSVLASSAGGAKKTTPGNSSDRAGCWPFQVFVDTIAKIGRDPDVAFDQVMLMRSMWPRTGAAQNVVRSLSPVSNLDFAHDWLIAKSTKEEFIWVVNFAYHPEGTSVKVEGQETVSAYDQICWGLKESTLEEIFEASHAKGLNISGGEEATPHPDSNDWIRLDSPMKLSELRQKMLQEDSPYFLFNGGGKNCQKFSSDLFKAVVPSKDWPACFKK